MKKRLLICIAMLIFILFSINAQSYYDWNNGYSGSAVAYYLGTTKTINPAQVAEDAEHNMRSIGLKVTGYCQKLSKTESFLIWSALNEYDYNDGEVYSLVINPSNNITALCLVVVITNGGKSFQWYDAVYVTP